MLRDEKSARALLDAQRAHWERSYCEAPDKFGRSASFAARRAAAIFATISAARILELGCGGGRDAIFFAECRFAVDALDYAKSAIAECARSARARGYDARVRARVHDAREPFPYDDATFDGIFAHMFHSMALDDDQLISIFERTRKLVRPGGLVVFSVRTTDDPDASAGIALSPYLRDVEGDTIRFFSRACVDRLTRGFEILEVEHFEEGSLPKRLFLVTARNGVTASAEEHAEARVDR